SLQWNISGESLQVFDSYDNNSVGTADGSITGFDGTGYTAAAAGFTIVQGSDGNNYIKATIGSGFPTLLRNTPSVNICNNYMVEGDMMLPNQANVGADAHMVIAENSGSCQGYMVAISKDMNPANFFLQKSTGCGGGQPTYPVKLQNGNAALPVSIVQGQWYTVKVLLTYSAGVLTINGKVWVKGTTEPSSWTFSYADASPIACTPAVGTYQIGWQGDSTATEDDFANLRYFAADPATNTLIYDTVPANLTYGGSDNGGTLSTGQVQWSIPGTIFSANGIYNWWATVGGSCNPIVNTASMHTAQMTSGAINSNAVTLTVSGCGTPTNTPTNTPSNT
ncbi:MAG TPA: hypothetical protein VJ873_11255, partial [bacterium]|nr:hypothetical protein [bacterium]